ncbi:DUF2510 domain-containing protein [Nocardioides sp. W3-2-3]|uniref:hypothetical protein n=1 Tax=Nocardioides convexus TaxID=2712224 RepID=UPI002418B191|nr:hypothetical protein [Nocardioides convexus]NHA00484.1 DUF2510 domain-containing protein [Nocardioides convexus]
MSDFSTPAGWYPDGDGWERRWDGTGWTDERRRMAEPTQVRPPQPPAAPPAAPPAGPPPQAPQQFSPQPPQQHWSPQPPPGYGHIPSGGVPQHAAPQHGYGGYPPATSPPRKSRLGLWIGLAVVLLLVAGTAITLVALKPWDDGSTSADDPKDPGGGGSSKAAIQGDIDGDGKGDARYYVYQDYDDVKKVRALSTGNGFKAERGRRRPLQGAEGPLLRLGR